MYLTRYAFESETKYGWTRLDIKTLRGNLKTSRRNEYTLVAKYQASRMRTLQFHLSKHFAGDMNAMGRIEHFHSDLNEGFYKASKVCTERRLIVACTLGSRLWKKQADRFLTPKNPKGIINLKRENSVCSSGMSDMLDNTCFVSNGMKTSLMQLILVQKSLCQKLEGRTKMNNADSITGFESTMLPPRTDAISGLTDLLLETFENLKVPFIEALHYIIQLPACTNCTGNFSPALSRCKIGSIILMLVGSYRIFQRFVANLKLYGKEGGRHDSLMIESRDRSARSDVSLFPPVCFAKALLFVCTHLPGSG